MTAHNSKPDLLRLVVASAQLIAVLAVCVNHFKITLLMPQLGFLPDSIATNPALVGMEFLFLSSGFLSQLHLECAERAAEARQAPILQLIASRFLFLALPCYALYFSDVFVMWFADFGPSMRLERVLPSLLGLMQSWSYDAAGSVSAGLPLNASNMAWLGSSLFFLSVFHFLTASIWKKLNSATAWAGLLLFAGLQFAQFQLISLAKPQIDAFATVQFGTLADDYTLSRWLIEYSPYAFLFAFLCGVTLARILRASAFNLPTSGTVAVIGIFDIYFQPFWPTHAFGSAMVVFAGLIAAIATVGENRATGIAKCLESTLPLRRSAYVIFIAHLAFFQLFTAQAAIEPSPSNVLYLLIRLLLTTGFVMVMCTGLYIYVFEPLRQLLLRKLQVVASDDSFI